MCAWVWFTFIFCIRTGCWIFSYLFIIILILLLRLYSPLSFHSSLPCFTLHSCFNIMGHSFIVHTVFSNIHLYSEYYKGFSKLQMLYSLMSICWFSHCVFCISVIMFCLREPHFSWSFFFHSILHLFIDEAFFHILRVRIRYKICSAKKPFAQIAELWPYFWAIDFTFLLFYRVERVNLINI